MKICSSCGGEFPATKGHFYANKSSKDGLVAQCKGCRKMYHLKNREAHNAYRRQYQKDNKDILAAKKKDYHDKNKELISERGKLYYQKNKEVIAECGKRYYCEKKEFILKRNKKYYDLNKENINEWDKEYRNRNKESIVARIRKYGKEHRDESKLRGEKRRSVKRQLPATLTLGQWESIKLQFENKCAYCGKERTLTQDHFVPLDKGGEYTHNNIIPACKHCNCSKRNSNFFDWYPRQRFYSKKREKALLAHLGYKEKIQQLALM